MQQTSGTNTLARSLSYAMCTMQVLELFFVIFNPKLAIAKQLISMITSTISQYSLSSDGFFVHCIS